MNSGQIIKSKSTDRFTTIPNGILRSTTLTLEQKGLLCFLLSLPADWVLYKTQLHEALNEKKGKIDRVFSELQGLGYILSAKQVDEKGRFKGWNHIVYDEPTTSVSPTSVKPEVGETTPILNTELSTKKENNIHRSENLKETEDRYMNFIGWFNEKRSSHFTGKDQKAKKQFIARIKEGYTFETFELALNRMMADPFHIDNHFKFITPEFLTRANKLEQFANVK